MSRRVAGWLLALALVVLLICVAFSWRQGDRSSPSAEESPASTKTVSAVAAPTATPPPDVVAQRASLTVEINGILALKAARDRAPRFGRFFKEWFDRDPEGAILYLEKMPRQREYTAGLLIALGGLAKTDPDRAIRLAGTMATRKADLIVYKALFDQLTRENPSRAAELLDHIPEGDARRKATRTLVEEWADKDPLAALAWARAIPELLQRDAGIEAALTVLARTRPAESIAFAQQSLNGAALTRVLTTGLRRLTESDPMGAGEIVFKLQPGAVRKAAALDVARALARDRPDAAIEWLQALQDPKIQTAGVNNVLDMWAASNPEAAKNYILSIPAVSLQRSAAVHLATVLAAKDPTGVFDWSEKLPDESTRTAVAVGIASAWARTDPESATRWAGTFPEENPARAEAINSALSYWALTDPVAASSFVPGLSETEQPRAAIAVAGSLAKSDPAAALAWTKSLVNEDVRTLAADEVVARWATKDPATAAAWVAGQSETQSRVDQARSVVENWVRKDATGARAWVQSLPVGPSRDGALDMLAVKIAQTDPALAMQMALSIASPQLRAARIEQLGVSSKK